MSRSPRETENHDNSGAVGAPSSECFEPPITPPAEYRQECDPLRSPEQMPPKPDTGECSKKHPPLPPLHTVTVRPSIALRGSGSFPTMTRARTANRNKITKRNSESSVILTGGIYTGKQSSPFPGEKKYRRNHRHPPYKKKSIYSRASRRKSLENLGLVVRNRCGSAKLQWPSEKTETDPFDLLPEGCLQVRQLRLPKDEAEYKKVGGMVPGRPLQQTSSSTFHLKVGLGIDHQRASQCQSPLLSIPCTEGSSNNNVKTDWKNKHNISVIVRIRPKQAKEVPQKSIVFRTDSKTIVFDPKEKTKDFYFQGVKQSTRSDFGRKRPNRNVCFQFDKVYGPESSNKQIFNEALKDLTDHLIEGFNSTVFAYGATGSGKTYTMIGSNSNPGLIVLMVEALYQRIDEIAEDFDCDVVCSYLEVYNETIKDLLKPEKELFIREDGKKGIIIPELTFYKPRGPNELLKLLRNGNRARTQHATDLNAESSRSHAVFEVKLCLKKKTRTVKNESREDGDNDETFSEDNNNLPECDMGDEEDGPNQVEVIQSKLVMVDLAGSERGAAATPGSSAIVAGNVGGFFMEGIGARQREGASINKSLLALANCISALADGKCHIPFRNSKLTRLLKDALSGNCTTVMIANISPSTLSSEDTYNTLKYADRAKNIVGPGMKQRNVFLEDLLLEDNAKLQVQELQAKVIQLSEMLEIEKQRNNKFKKEYSVEYSKQRKLEADALISDRRNNSAKESNENAENKNMCTQQRGGGDADSLSFHNMKQRDVPKEEIKAEVESVSTPNEHNTEDKPLPKEIQKYLHLIKERARIYSEYVQFASNTRLNEWTSSCKKLKADMADVLGTLPVTDQNYVNYCKLKNEVNSTINSNLSDPIGVSLLGSNYAKPKSFKDVSPPPGHIQHKKYALKIKNLTEKIELLRLECVANNLLTLSEGSYTAPMSSRLANSPESATTVSISLEEYLQFKRLVGEQEGNDKMEQFYQQFSRQITDQLITSGMTLMHALKIIRRLLKSDGDPTSVACLQQEYKELSDFVYGLGSIPSQMFNQLDMISKEAEKSGTPMELTVLPPLPSEGRPSTGSVGNLGGRRSKSNLLILEDLHKLKKLVDKPLLIQLTSLIGAEDEDEEDADDDMDFVGNEYGNDDHFENSIRVSPSKETLLPSDPEGYGTCPPETDYMPSTAAGAAVPSTVEGGGRRRRLWKDTNSSSTAYMNESLISTALPPPPPPFSMQSATSAISNKNKHGNPYRRNQSGYSYCENENIDEHEPSGSTSKHNHKNNTAGTRSRTSESRRSHQSQCKSDYDWYTTSTATSTELSTAATSKHSSASNSIENIVKARQGKECNSNRRKEKEHDRNGKASNGRHLGNVKKEDEKHQKKENSSSARTVQEKQQKRSTSSNIYTYRLDSPSEVAKKAYSQMYKQSSGEIPDVDRGGDGKPDSESGESEDDEEDDDDEEEEDDDDEDEDCEEDDDEEEEED